ncbi:DinB family protein [Actinosynnema sp. NPDC020468]|uniref:DinB family protein n=1 Tax=Actinosynnema sp. NPDC020468 TaxID=3154488 RepID=UPI00340CA42C
MDYCAECDFSYDGASVDVESVVRGGVEEIGAWLRSAGESARPRRQPGVWSPLEYGCHVRDVLFAQRERVLMAWRGDLRDWAPMGRDERVEHEGYAEQDVEAVARQLQDAASLFLNVVGRLSERERAIVIRYPYPEPRPQPLEWVALHTAHEVRHHLLDVRRQG